MSPSKNPPLPGPVGQERMRMVQSEDEYWKLNTERNTKILEVFHFDRDKIFNYFKNADTADFWQRFFCFLAVPPMQICVPYLCIGSYPNIKTKAEQFSTAQHVALTSDGVRFDLRISGAHSNPLSDSTRNRGFVIQNLVRSGVSQIGTTIIPFKNINSCAIIEPDGIYGPCLFPCCSAKRILDVVHLKYSSEIRGEAIGRNQKRSSFDGVFGTGAAKKYEVEANESCLILHGLCNPERFAAKVMELKRKAVGVEGNIKTVKNKNREKSPIGKTRGNPT